MLLTSVMFENVEGPGNIFFPFKSPKILLLCAILPENNLQRKRRTDVFFYNSRFFQATVTLTLWSSINLNTQRYLAIFAWFLLTGAALGGLDSDLRCMGANTVSLRIVRQRARGFFFFRSKAEQNKISRDTNPDFCLVWPLRLALIYLTDMQV